MKVECNITPVIKVPFFLYFQPHQVVITKKTAHHGNRFTLINNINIDAHFSILPI